MEETTTIPLVSRRRARALLFQQIQHGLPSVVLLMNGIRGLQSGEGGLARWVALAELVTSIPVIVGIARSIRHTSRANDERALAHHGGPGEIDWVDLFLSAMLATEAWSRYHHTGHVPRPTILLAGVMLLLGLSHGRIAAIHARRRALRATGDGLTIGGRWFTRFTARWSELEAIEIGERYATISARGGRTKTIDLNDLRNRAQVVEALNRMKEVHCQR